MDIVQQLPSKSGNFRNNVIQGVREVYAGRAVMPITNTVQDVVVCELPFGKKYSIGYFPSIEYRDKCINFIDENKAKSALILSLEDFFMQDYLAPSLVDFVVENYTLQGYLQNLLGTHFNKLMISELMDLDAFIGYNAPDLVQMKKGHYVSVKNYDQASIWSRTLPISNELASYGITKKEYFKSIIQQHEKNNNNNYSGNRVVYGMST